NNSTLVSSARGRKVPGACLFQDAGGCSSGTMTSSRCSACSPSWNRPVCCRCSECTPVMANGTRLPKCVKMARALAVSEEMPGTEKKSPSMMPRWNVPTKPGVPGSAMMTDNMLRVSGAVYHGASTPKASSAETMEMIAENHTSEEKNKAPAMSQGERKTCRP